MKAPHLEQEQGGTFVSFLPQFQQSGNVTPLKDFRKSVNVRMIFELEYTEQILERCISICNQESRILFGVVSVIGGLVAEVSGAGVFDF